MFQKTAGLISAGMLAAVIMGGIATANPSGRGGPGGPGGRGGPPLIGAIKQVDLSEDQVSMLKSFKEEAKADREDKRAEAEGLREQILEELKSGKPSAGTIHKTIDKLEALKSDGKHQMIDNMLEVYATFTPEQVDQFVDALENPPERGEARGRGQGRGHGPPPGRGFDGPPPGDF